MLNLYKINVMTRNWFTQCNYFKKKIHMNERNQENLDGKFGILILKLE